MLIEPKLDDNWRGRFCTSVPIKTTAIVVDDGIATGATMPAALAALRKVGLHRLVLAVPVAPPETAEALRTEADELVCLETPEPFGAVGAATVWTSARSAIRR